MKKLLLGIICIIMAANFAGCSTESSFHSESSVSVSTSNTQDLIDKGDKNLDAGKYDEAIKNYNDVLKEDSDEIAAYNGRGIAYGKKNDFDSAIKDFAQTIKLDPNYAEGYNNRGMAYGGKGEIDKALADFNKAIELDSAYAQAYNNRGAAYMAKGDQDKAIADFKKALELDPNNKDAKDNLKSLSQ
ncbi:MAG: tetratricopeptide repeat protein [Quinella sp. 1Q5]|nr:tetratricopeptide repeat protein [Quinella sp. 1Q5]